jgi:transposase
MLGDISKADAVWIACGYTDMRKSIDGLAAYVQQAFGLDPMSNTVFLFCGHRSDRLKALFWEGDGFILMYKRLEGGGRYQWPRSPEEAKKLTWQQLRWLLEGLKVEQKTALKTVGKRIMI